MDHSPCPHHEAVQVTLDRIAAHCNGTHVRLEDIVSCQEAINAVTQDTRRLTKEVSDLAHRAEVEKAAGSRWLTLLIALITTAGVVAQAIITHLLR